MTLSGVFPELVGEDIKPAVTNRGKPGRGVRTEIPLSEGPRRPSLEVAMHAFAGVRGEETDLFWVSFTLVAVAGPPIPMGPCLKVSRSHVCATRRKGIQSRCIP